MWMVEAQSKELPVVSCEFDKISGSQSSLHLLHFIAEDPLVPPEDSFLFLWIQDDLLSQTFLLPSEKIISRNERNVKECVPIGEKGRTRTIENSDAFQYIVSNLLESVAARNRFSPTILRGGFIMDQLRFFRHAGFSSGEITRVRQILRPSGTTFILPYDQFVEHDCRHLEAHSDSGNPKYILELARDAGHNAVALHYGLSRRFWS